MHSGLIVFHSKDSDAREMMNPYHLDSEEDSEFTEELAAEDAEKEYERICKEGAEFKEMSVEEALISYHGYIKSSEEGEGYGYMSNPNGMYDWCVVGGRWKNTLPFLGKEAKKEHKRISKDMTLWKERMYEQAKFVSMPAEEALIKYGFATYTMSLKNINIEFLKNALIKLAEHKWEEIQKREFKHNTDTKEEYVEKMSTMKGIFSEILCENEGMIHSPEEQDFWDKIEEWKKTNGGMVTVIDYHY